MSKRTINLIVVFGVAFFLFPPLIQAQVTLTVGDGSGYRGSHNNPVGVSLNNSGDKVKQVLLDVCDTDDYLDVLRCDTTSRSSDGFGCQVISLPSGCARVVLSSPGGVIDLGSGDIVTLRYNVDSGAPAGQSRALSPQNIFIKDEFDSILTVTPVSGDFTFLSCSSGVQCNDGLYCNGSEGCSGGACTHTNNPCPETECNHCNEATDSCFDPPGTACPGDGLFCTACNGSGACTSANNPCPPNFYCDEVDDACDCMSSCFRRGAACTGCDEGICYEPGEVCSPGDNGCYIFNVNDECTGGGCSGCYQLDVPCNYSDCSDGVFCNGEEYCFLEECTPSLSGPCLPTLTCNEGEDECNCVFDGDCDDNKFCTGTESCAGDVCQQSGNPCSGPEPYCDESEDQCYDFSVTVALGDGTGVPGDRLLWSLPFDNGTEEFHDGATLTGISSFAEGVIVSYVRNSGDWGAGTAAGLLTLKLKNITYTFLNNEVIEDDGNPQGSARVNGTATVLYPDPRVTVSLQNPQDNVQGIEMFICDENDYLEAVPTCASQNCDPVIVGCEKLYEPQGTSFACDIGEIINPQDEHYGCASVAYFSAVDVIPATGSFRPLFTIKYGVKAGVPTGLINQIPEIETIVDGGGSRVYGEGVDGTFDIYCTDDVQCDDGLYCTGVASCVGSECQAGTDPCQAVPDTCCDESQDACLFNPGDSDCDAISDAQDNCPETYNPTQDDTLPPQGNGLGNACDCEGNFDCDQDVDGTDAQFFKTDFGRSMFLNPCISANPCNGDFDCDGDVDGTDAQVFKNDFGRSMFQDPCPSCVIGLWCSYL